MNEEKARFAALSYERILDELEFIQRVMELYDIPESVGTKITEHVGGMLEKYEHDMLDLIEFGDSSTVSAYLDVKDNIHIANVGGITRVNK